MDAGIGSAVLAARLVGYLTPPSRAAIRHESAERLHQALDCREPADREVLTPTSLRGDEQPSRGHATRTQQAARPLSRCSKITSAFLWYNRLTPLSRLQGGKE